MSKLIRQLVEQATTIEEHGWGASYANFDQEKFALLIVQECASRVDNILREKKDGGGTMGDEIREHFGVEESRTQPDQEAAEFIATENKKVARKYGYFPKLHPSEWKD